jgi:hypothetical protein
LDQPIPPLFTGPFFKDLGIWFEGHALAMEEPHPICSVTVCAASMTMVASLSTPTTPDLERGCFLGVEGTEPGPSLPAAAPELYRPRNDLRQPLYRHHCGSPFWGSGTGMFRILLQIADAVAADGPLGVHPSEYSSIIATIRFVQEAHTHCRTSFSLILLSFLV